MKKYLFALILLTAVIPLFGQRSIILDELKHELTSITEDTTKVQLIADISEIYSFLDEDSCQYYTDLGLKLANEIKYSPGQARMLYCLGINYRNTGDLPKALKCYIQVQQIATKDNDKPGIARGLFGMGLIYLNIEPHTAIQYMLEARKLNQAFNNSRISLVDRIDINLGTCYMTINKLDSAFIYLNDLYQRTSPDEFHYSPALLFFGILQFKLGHSDMAIKLLKQSVNVARNDNDHYSMADSYYYLAVIYDKLSVEDSAIYYSKNAFDEAKMVNRKNQMLVSANLLSKLYEPVNLKESYRYLKLTGNINDELYGLKKTQDLQKLVLEEQQQQQQIQKEQLEKQNQLKQNGFLAGLGVLFVIAFILFRNNQQRKKTNKIIQAENDRKTKELEDARLLQLAMLPREIPKLPNLEIAVYMKTATEVGGDYYDFHIHNDGTLTVILGDATGHGLMSGMMVSVMKSLFMSDRTNKDLKAFFENSNSAIKEMRLSRLMMPLTGVQIYSDKMLTTNAGMPPLFIYRASTQRAEEVVINNMPLGAMKGVCYNVKEIKVDKGDVILLMSDGFAELKNRNDELYGYNRALNSFLKVAGKMPEEIIEYLKKEGRCWTNDKELEDDVTFVVIKIK